jgi:hypothetical protein
MPLLSSQTPDSWRRLNRPMAPIRTPTGANAILVRNLEITPLEAETVNRDLVRPYLGASDQLLAQTRVSMTFEVEMAGSGTAGTAPAYGPLLKGLRIV